MSNWRQISVRLRNTLLIEPIEIDNAGLRAVHVSCLFPREKFMDKIASTGFTCAYQDSATLAYPLGNGYRWYLPSLMRFAASDFDSPFGAGGLNPYTYCGADPVNRTDPSGHAWIPTMGEDVMKAMDEAMARERAAPEAIATMSAVQSAYLEPLTDEKKEAGSVILRHWRRFLNQRKSVPDATRRLALSLGVQITDGTEYESLMRDERVVVQANGTPHDPTSGHSAIYHKYIEYGLELSDFVGDDDESASRYGMSANVASHFNNKYGVGYFREGGRSFLNRRLVFSDDGKIDHIARKGNLFALDKKFSQNFSDALARTEEQLHNGPYSYGLNYNCNTFVYYLLKRLRDMTP